MDENNKSLENVTTRLLELGCRILGIKLSLQEVDLIIDLVELIDLKGGEVTLKDLTDLKDLHNNL